MTNRKYRVDYLRPVRSAARLDGGDSRGRAQRRLRRGLCAGRAPLRVGSGGRAPVRGAEERETRAPLARAAGLNHRDDLLRR